MVMGQRREAIYSESRSRRTGLPEEAKCSALSKATTNKRSIGIAWRSGVGRGQWELASFLI